MVCIDLSLYINLMVLNISNVINNKYDGRFDVLFHNDCEGLGNIYYFYERKNSINLTEKEDVQNVL